MTYKTQKDVVNYWENREEPNSERLTDIDLNFLKENLKGRFFLEYGAGIGRTFEAYPEQSNVVSLDITKNYSLRARKEARKHNLIYTDLFSENGILDNEFKDKIFDSAVCSAVLLHVLPEQIKETIKELVRVSKRLLIINFYDKENKTNMREHNFNHDIVSVINELGFNYEGEWLESDKNYRIVVTE